MIVRPARTPRWKNDCSAGIMGNGRQGPRIPAHRTKYLRHRRNKKEPGRKEVHVPRGATKPCAAMARARPRHAGSNPYASVNIHRRSMK